MALLSSMFSSQSSRQLVSLAVRTVGSARAFDRGISKIPSAAYMNYDSDLDSYHDPLLSSNSFMERASTTEPHHGTLQKMSVQQSLLQGIKSQIETLQKDLDKFRAVEGSDEFPFEITKVNHRRQHYWQDDGLKRELEDEIVEVSVKHSISLNNDPDSTTSELKQQDSPNIPMYVSVFRKSTGMMLECNISAFPERDVICLHSFWINKVLHSSGNINWEKTGVASLDDDFQKKIIKYLEVLGIKPNIIELWKANLKYKENRDCLIALENFKGFIEGGIFSSGKKQ